MELSAVARPTRARRHDSIGHRMKVSVNTEANQQTSLTFYLYFLITFNESLQTPNPYHTIPSQQQPSSPTIYTTTTLNTQESTRIDKKILKKKNGLPSPPHPFPFTQTTRHPRRLDLRHGTLDVRDSHPRHFQLQTLHGPGENQRGIADQDSYSYSTGGR